jgi:hypothetical protein
MKICSVCRTEKPLSDYFKSTKTKGGYEHRCKVCKVEVNRASYMRNKKAVKLRMIERKYGLDEDAYLDMLDGGCEVCGSVQNLCVDHDHSCCPVNSATCGKCIRGILCRRCNMVEGVFKNDAKNIKNLVKYMQKHGIIK